MVTGTVAGTDKGIGCKLHTKRKRTSVNLAGLNEVFGGLEGASILGGNEAGRFSYWAARPREVFEFRMGEDRPFEKLQQVLSKYKLEGGSDEDLPKGIFVGGWVGYFGYELGRYIEKVPVTAVDDLQMPLIRLSFYDRVICYDNVEGVCWLIALELGDEGSEEKIAELEGLLEKSEGISVSVPEEGNLEGIDFSKVGCNIEKDYYAKAIKRIKKYIYDGEVYQVNFSQRFESNYKGEAIDLFGWENHFNPSGYAGYIDGGDFQIVSASPEMFVTIRDGAISTKPIKGTRKRIAETDSTKAKVNEKNFEELARSEKEQAELNMIIDLERNDLGRICEYGTIKVVQGRTIESYPTVFHAVATVEGRLRGEISFCDILRAMFPGGSITGAPKVSSMKIIDEAEPTERGVYTGSIGFIGIDGSVCLNIAIRTIIITKNKAYAQTGGGIVADSSAEAEWEETLTKARALLAGINTANRGKLKT